MDTRLPSPFFLKEVTPTDALFNKQIEFFVQAVRVNQLDSSAIIELIESNKSMINKLAMLYFPLVMELPNTTLWFNLIQKFSKHPAFLLLCSQTKKTIVFKYAYKLEQAIKRYGFVFSNIEVLSIKSNLGQQVIKKLDNIEGINITFPQNYLDILDEFEEVSSHFKQNNNRNLRLVKHPMRGCIRLDNHL